VGDRVTDELVPVPASGRVFTGTARGRLSETTAAGRVRLDTLARWLQDVAFDDVTSAGLASHGAWVVRRTRLLVPRFPRFDEPVALQTFCSGIGPRWAQRRTVLRGEWGGTVEADALWIFLDPQTLQPMRFTPEFDTVYAEAAGGRRAARARLFHPSPPAEPAHREDWVFRVTDRDIADHVNNAAYWEVVEERLPSDDVDGIDLEIEYRDAAQPGPARVLRDGDLTWVTSPSGDVVHASIRRA
jgi:acyl-ACP thioesterase